MHLNKLVRTKLKERVYVIAFNEEEFEDLRSALSMSVRVSKKDHKDSPSFQKALVKMDKKLTRLAKDAYNRAHQKGWP